jgi:hypothetical protein
MTETTERPMPAIGAWRRADRLREGWQVLNGVQWQQDGTEEWWTVTHALHILAPMRVSSVTFDNGKRGGMAAFDEVFCRTPTEIKRAAAKAGVR